ncbi:MAG TPA: hypothetical protein VI756_05090, partial [Blastocatellia bacterium]
SAARPRAGLSVTWFEYRGPAKVAFDRDGPIPVDNGQAVARATFSQPGTYVLRATANDGQLSTPRDVTIQVGPRR